MKLYKRITKQRTRRTYRVRNKLRNSARPRLSVYRSNLHIYAQLIDDTAGTTIVSASSKDKGFSGKTGGNCEAAAEVGKLLAERAREKGITAVAFDRGPYKFHGRVKALADAAREAGLEF